MELMRIPRRFWETSVDRIPESAHDRVFGYCKAMGRMLDDGVGYLFWGPNGVGKTSAAVFLAMEARRHGAPVLFVNAESLRSGVLEKQAFRDDVTLIDRARTVDVLVIDDLGKEHPGQTGFTERLFENLFRERSAARKTTFVTTNMSIEKLRERYKPSMLEVMKETCYPVQVEGPSQRDDAPGEIRERLATG
jgi:DNA replication protein DnaC